jgi:hypothetical protein
MPIFNDAFTEHEIKRGMRPDAHRYLRPDWRRFLRAGYENDSLYRLYESIERKFSSDQPRVPAGNPEGGQWTNGGGASGSGSTVKTPTAETSKPGAHIAARISPEREAECELQYRQDTFICNTIGTASCWRQAAFRYSQCLIGGYIPPLYH